AMDPASLSAGFIVSTGGKSVPGRFVYSGATAMFIPAEDLKPGARYEGRITTDARDLAGNALPSELVWTFATEANQNVAAVAVRSTQPADQTAGIEIYATVQ